MCYLQGRGNTNGESHGRVSNKKMVYRKGTKMKPMGSWCVRSREVDMAQSHKDRKRVERKYEYGETRQDQGYGSPCPFFILDKPAFVLSLIRSVLSGHAIGTSTREDENASVEDLPGALT